MQSPIPKYIDTIPKSDKFYRLIWRLISLFLFRPFSLPFFNGWRLVLLRVFGAKIGPGSIVHSSAYIPSPRNISIGKESAIGPEVKFHFGKTYIGDKVTISQRTYLCSATHKTNSLNTTNCGWWIDLSIENLKSTLQKAMYKSPEELKVMGLNGRKLVEEQYDIKVVAEKMVKLYSKILNK